MPETTALQKPQDNLSQALQIAEGETNVAASAAEAQALVQARFIIAMRPENRRQWGAIEVYLLELCEDLDFA